MHFLVVAWATAVHWKVRNNLLNCCFNFKSQGEDFRKIEEDVSGKFIRSILPCTQVTYSICKIKWN